MTEAPPDLALVESLIGAFAQKNSPQGTAQKE